MLSVAVVVDSFFWSDEHDSIELIQTDLGAFHTIPVEGATEAQFSDEVQCFGQCLVAEVAAARNTELDGGDPEIRAGKRIRHTQLETSRHLSMDQISNCRQVDGFAAVGGVRVEVRVCSCGCFPLSGVEIRDSCVPPHFVRSAEGTQQAPPLVERSSCIEWHGVLRHVPDCRVRTCRACDPERSGLGRIK